MLISNSTGTEIIESFATPKNNPTGLAWDGEYLWLAHDQGYDKGLITKIDPNNGNVLGSFPTPGNDPKGLAWGDGYLWIIDQQDSKYKIFKIDPKNNGKIVDYDSLNALKINRPIGLAYGGNHLWVIDGEDKKIYNIDLLEQTYSPINSPTSYPTDLAWDGSNLYIGSENYNREVIYKMNPATKVSEKIDLPGENPSIFGLTWDGNYLWMIDNNAGIIYKLKINSLVLSSIKYNVINTNKSSEKSPSINSLDYELLNPENETYYVKGTVSDPDGTVEYVEVNGKRVEGTSQFGGVVHIYGDLLIINALDNNGESTRQEVQINKSYYKTEPISNHDDSIIGSIIDAIGNILVAIIGLIGVIVAAYLYQKRDDLFS